MRIREKGFCERERARERASERERERERECFKYKVREGSQDANACDVNGGALK
jgi:hypothetical protein